MGKADFLRLGDWNVAVVTSRMGPRPTSVAERFWRYVDKRGMDECWNWTGSLSQSGYGRLAFMRYPLYAHRISYELHKGKIPDGLHILHSCDNPACVNPHHLSVGTQKDNMIDCKKKERNVYRVTFADAALIRETYPVAILDHPKMDVQARLAEKFNVSTRTIRLIIAGERRNPSG